MDIKEIAKLDEQYFFNVFGKRLPAYMEKGEGVYLYDNTGKKYVDFLAGIAVNSLGYSDEGFKEVLHKQVDNLLHSSNYFYSEMQAKLAKVLCENAGYKRAFFANSGAEANECALKIAKKYFYNKGQERHHFVALKQSFHGRTIASLTATGQEKFHTPFLPMLPYQFTYVEANDADAVKNAITDKTAGVIYEYVQGEGGVIPLTREFVNAIHETCQKTGTIIIADEVQTGMGRCGSLLAQDLYGVKANVVTLAKALGNGVPIGAVLADEKVCDVFKPGDHGSTFGGNHLACAAGLYVATKLTTTDIIKNAAKTGEYFKEKLLALKNKVKCIKEVRGKGLLLAAELDESVSAAQIKHALFDEGFLICTAGKNALRFLPPLIIEPKHIDMLISKMEDLLKCQD